VLFRKRQSEDPGFEAWNPNLFESLGEDPRKSVLSGYSVVWRGSKGVRTPV
jgi:hypothetical protein